MDSGMGGGAITSTVRNNIIENNRIEHSAYNGISVSGGRVVENRIKYTCLKLSDCGGIYISSGSGEIRDNRVEHAHGVAEGLGQKPGYVRAAGIYLDEGAHDVIVKSNEIYDVDTKYHVHKSTGWINGGWIDCTDRSCDPEL